MRIALFIAISVLSVDGFDTYRLRIPNGLTKMKNGITAVGHTNKFGGGRATEFGYDFKRLGTKWTKELCEKDSDGDGATNGEELGDPCCTWKVGRSVLPNPTSPGHKDSFTEEQLAALKCNELPSKNDDSFRSSDEL